MRKPPQPPITTAAVAPASADETYDVYSVFALMPEVVESPYFRFHYVVLLSAFVGVPSGLIGASETLRRPKA